MTDAAETKDLQEWPIQAQRNELIALNKRMRRGIEEVQDLAEELKAMGLTARELVATRDAVRESVAGLFEPGSEGKLNQLREMHADLKESLLALHKNTAGYIRQELEGYAAAQRVRSIDEEAIHRTVTHIESLIAQHRLLLTGDVENARKEWRAAIKDHVQATLVESLGDINVLHRVAEYIGRHISKLPELRAALVREASASISNEIREFIRAEVERRIPRDTQGSEAPDEMPPTVRVS